MKKKVVLNIGPIKSFLINMIHIYAIGGELTAYT